jgi:hypothetical protein
MSNRNDTNDTNDEEEDRSMADWVALVKEESLEAYRARWDAFVEENEPVACWDALAKEEARIKKRLSDNADIKYKMLCNAIRTFAAVAEP